VGRRSRPVIGPVIGPVIAPVIAIVIGVLGLAASLCPTSDAPVTARTALWVAPSVAPGSLAGSGAPSVLAQPGGVVWAYDGSQILRSTDAGTTWKAMLPTWPLTQTSLQVTGAFFLNSEDAWAETEHQWPAQPGATTIWRTADGGVTWDQGFSLPGAPSYGTPGFDEFAFADSEHGFGFGVDAANAPGAEAERQGSMWVTFNGGRDWGRLAAIGLPWQGSIYSAIPGQGCTETDPFNLTVVSAGVVLLADEGCPLREPGLWRSADGGRQWRPILLPGPPGGWAGAEAWGYPSAGEGGAEVLALRFFADGHGIAAVTTRPGELLVYRSADAGGSWSLASELETGSLARPAGFWASSPVAWELPAPAALYVTTDAGRHWRLGRSGLTLPAMTEVSFASPTSGIGFPGLDSTGVASSGDAGLRTTDGGLSWAAVRFAVPSFLGDVTADTPFGAVAFVNSEDGWVGGADGVEATTDGGKVWSAQLSTPEPVEALSFADSKHGWALTPDQLLATSDGGLEWSAQPATALGAFSYVQLLSPGFGVGVICGQPGGTRALVTYNQGRTWRSLPIPGANEIDCGSAAPSPGTIAGLCFGTPRVGWVVLRGPRGGSALVEKTGDGGGLWSAVATVNAWPGALACQGTLDVWLGFTYGEHGTLGSLVATTDGGNTWRASMHPPPHSPVPAPVVTPVDRTVVGTLGTSQSPAGILAQPVAGLAAPAPDDAVDLWEDYGPSCASGFGLAVTTDAGTSWAEAPGRAPAAPPCGSFALPFLNAVPNLALALSFPDAAHGFVLGPVAGTPVVPKGVTENITMALVGTADGGTDWHLVARFPWRSPGPA
jgi:photosystem II stability/assembly factor-like uncharacterized protein